MTVDVECVNDDPIADDDTIMVDENSSDNDVTADILDNDSDIEGDTLTVSSVFNATGGTVNLAAGVVTFTPDADLCGNGEASFEYAISDGHGGTDSAHVTVDINCVSNVPPVAVDDSFSGHRGHRPRHRQRRPRRQRRRHRQRSPSAPSPTPRAARWR